MAGFGARHEGSKFRRYLSPPDAFALAPLGNATVLSLVFAALASFRLVVRKRTISSGSKTTAYDA